MATDSVGRREPIGNESIGKLSATDPESFAHAPSGGTLDSLLEARPDAFTMADHAPGRRATASTPPRTTCGCTSRGTRRTTTHDVPMIVRGDGAYIWDANGKRYLDGLAGLFVVPGSDTAAPSSPRPRPSRPRSSPSSRCGPTRTPARSSWPSASRATRRATSTASSSPPAAARPSRPRGSWPSSTSS